MERQSADDDHVTRHTETEAPHTWSLLPVVTFTNNYTLASALRKWRRSRRSAGAPEVLFATRHQQ